MHNFNCTPVVQQVLCPPSAAIGTTRCRVLSSENKLHVPLPAGRRYYERMQCRSTSSAVTVDAPPLSMPQVQFLGYKDGEFSVEGWLDCAVTPDIVYDCLTDYANLANTFTNITDTDVFTNPEHGGLQVKQVCKWEFLVFQGTFSLLLNVQEDREAGALTFDLVESGFMQSFLGVWTVTPLPNGGCRVYHRQQVRPTLAPPALVGEYTQPIFLRQVRNLFDDLQNAVDQRQGGAM